MHRSKVEEENEKEDEMEEGGGDTLLDGLIDVPAPPALPPHLSHSSLLLCYSSLPLLSDLVLFLVLLFSSSSSAMPACCASTCWVLAVKK